MFPNLMRAGHHSVAPNGATFWGAHDTGVPCFALHRLPKPTSDLWGMTPMQYSKR